MKIKELMESGVDHLTIVISRNQVDQNDIATPLNILNQLLSDTEISNFYKERIALSFDGYNNTREELWEIPDVRKYVMNLDSQFPYWLFFLNKNDDGLSVIIRCFLLPHLNAAGNKEHNLPRLESYLTNRGFPAMNQICDALELTEDENIEISDNVMRYIETKILI